MKKAIRLPQPIAHLVAHGHISSIQRFMEDITVPERYFICSAERNEICQDDLIIFDRDFMAQIVNAQTMGDLPKLENLPTSAFVGYVDIIKCESSNTGFLNEGWTPSNQFGMKDLYFANAHFFDESVPGSVGDSEFFDIPKETQRLLHGPEYTAKKPVPLSRSGETLFMSINDELFAKFAALNEAETAELSLYITPENLSLLCETFEGRFEANPLATDTISFFHKGVPLEMKVEDIEFQEVVIPEHKKIVFVLPGMPKESFKAKIVYRLSPILDSVFNRLEASTKSVLEAADKMGFSCIIEAEEFEDTVFLNNKKPFNYQGKDILCSLTVEPKQGLLNITASDTESMTYYKEDDILSAINHFNARHSNVWYTFNTETKCLSAHASTSFSNDILDPEIVCHLLERVFWRVYSSQKVLASDMIRHNKKFLNGEQ